MEPGRVGESEKQRKRESLGGIPRSPGGFEQKMGMST